MQQPIRNLPMIAAMGWRLSAFGDEVAAGPAEQATALRDLGIRHVEVRSAWSVNVVDLGSERLDRLARELAAAGIGVSAIASPVGKSELGADFEAETARLEAALDAAERLGSQLVRVFSFYVRGRHDSTRDEVLRRLDRLTGRAEARGATLVHENESFIYGDTPERCLELVEAIGSPAFKIAFDPANFVQVGAAPFTRAWPLLARHVVHFHVKDAVAIPDEATPEALMASVRPAGEGQGQLRELLGELETTRYSGFLTLEPHLQARLPDLDGAARLRVAAAALQGLLVPS